MTEAVAESADVLVKSCDGTSCDALSCPSPQPCLSDCSQKGGEEFHTDMKKLEQQKHCNQVQPKKKVKAKGKLVRSMAVCEESSPIEEIKTSPDADVSSSCHDNNRVSCKEEEQERSTDPKRESLSKESSVEYTDSTGIDLHHFIIDTLNSNPRDRMMLLKLEQDMIIFITSNSPFKKFPHMSSYHRMLVHRVAAYFGMEHNVDQTGKSVIINRTSSTRIPEQRFLDMVRKDKTEEIHQWKMILKRDNSLDDQNRSHLLRLKQSKSMEEREEDYQRAREQIFNKEPPCAQESAHAETRDVEEYNPYAETQRRRQLFRGTRDSSGSSWTGSSRQSSTETDCRYGSDSRPWSSTESDSSHQWTSPTLKPCQPASNTWDTRGSITLYRLPSSNPHLSPPPITKGPAPNSAYIMENGIPPGSILMNPLTGQPYFNPDGTPAVYNPPDNQQPIGNQTQLQGFPPQLPQQQIEDLSSQFPHMTVNCQSVGDAPSVYPASQDCIYAAPPAPNPSTCCQPSPQVPVYYYGQYPTSAQHGCRPVSPSQHIHTKTAPQAGGYTPAVRLQQSSTTQPQTVLGPYPPVAPLQSSMVQGGVSVSFPQSKVVTGGTGDAAYCCVMHQPQCTGLERTVLMEW